jgi:hypothetical protein
MGFGPPSDTAALQMDCRGFAVLENDFSSPWPKYFPFLGKHPVDIREDFHNPALARQFPALNRP